MNTAKQLIFAAGLALLLWAERSPAQSREIAITFDDAPRAGSALFSGEGRTAALIEALAEAGVAGTIFFSTGRHVDEAGMERLQAYVAAGHFIGNHSFQHRHPEDLGLEGYRADMEKADELFRPMEGFLPLYRFPFLNEGRSEAMRDGLREALTELGYENGYVTVDNYDWYMEALLQQALEAGRRVDYVRLGKVYVELLVDSVEFYDRIAVESLGRSPRHVLLLHENDLAALYIDDLARALVERGWTLIPGPDAYQDAIAERAPDTVFNGQGRVAALAEEGGGVRRELVHPSEDQAWLEDYFESRGIFGPAAAPDSGQ